jgi:hypothetical protein
MRQYIINEIRITVHFNGAVLGELHFCTDDQGFESNEGEFFLAIDFTQQTDRNRL